MIVQGTYQSTEEVVLKEAIVSKIIKKGLISFHKLQLKSIPWYWYFIEMKPMIYEYGYIKQECIF